MIQTLITSQTRIKMLAKFFLNSRTKAHLRGPETGEAENYLKKLKLSDLLPLWSSDGHKIESHYTAAAD